MNDAGLNILLLLKQQLQRVPSELIYTEHGSRKLHFWNLEPLAKMHPKYP